MEQMVGCGRERQNTGAEDELRDWGGWDGRMREGGASACMMLG